MRAEPAPTVPPPPPCPLVASSGWTAYIKPGHERGIARLAVTGRVTFPFVGWRLNWGRLAQLESVPPTVVIDFGGRDGPGGPINQVVQGEWDVSPTVASVTVRCGGDAIALLRPVLEAEH